ncbi:MAG: ATP-binding protein [Peptococcaceae bacterium]
MINRDQLRLRKQQECDARVAELYRQIPQLEELDQQIGQDNIAMIRQGVLKKDPQETKRLQQKIEGLIEQRHQLLAAHHLDESIYKPQWDCPLCEDRGYTEPGVLCSCYQKERLDELFLRSGMSEAMRNFTFHNFDVQYYEKPDEMEAKVAWCQQFARQAQQGSSEQSLFLTGGVGRGKTHLAAAIANLVLEKGGTVIYRRAVDLFELIRQYRYEENRQKLDEMMEQLRSCDLLVIDDLGAERTTEFVVEQLVVLLEDRNYRNKPWIITSNLNINEITSTYNDRTADRILDKAVLFKLEMPDSVRMQNARRRMDAF